MSADPLAVGSALQGCTSLAELVAERQGVAKVQSKPAEPAEDAPVTSLFGHRDAGLFTGAVCQGLG